MTNSHYYALLCITLISIVLFVFFADIILPCKADIKNKEYIINNPTIIKCRSLFLSKTKDYGTAWRIMRLSSLIDQMYIKIKRIATIMNTPAKVEEGVSDELIGIFNYSVIIAMQAKLVNNPNHNLSYNEAKNMYDSIVSDIIVIENDYTKEDLPILIDLISKEITHLRENDKYLRNYDYTNLTTNSLIALTILNHETETD